MGHSPPLPLHPGRDITAEASGFEELEAAALAAGDPWQAGLPSGGQELFDIWLARYVR